MSCPRCGAPCPPADAACAACGFHLGEVDQRLGDHAVVVNRLVDTQHLLSLRDSTRLEAQLDEFERRFPQAFCTLFLGVLPGGVSVGEGCFWLLNHGVRTCHGEVRSSQYGIAVVIDPSTHGAGLAVGYALEGILSNARAGELLHRVSPALWHGDYANAIARLVKGVDKVLRRHGFARRRPPPSGARKPRRLFGFERVAATPSPTEAER